MRLFVRVSLMMGALFGTSGASSERGTVPSVNFLFETFNPYSIVKFFEFSDKGWNISENCLKNMYNYLEGLQQGSVWAVKLYDSVQYYGGSSFSGYRYRLDTSAQCRLLQKEHLHALNMHWSLKTNTTAVPFPVQLINAMYQVEMNYNYHETLNIQQSICFPKNCDPNDLDQILAASLLPPNMILSSNMSLVAFRTIEGNYDVLQDGSFYTLITLLTSVLAITLCSHLYEFFLEMQKQHPDIPDEKKTYEDGSSTSLPSDLTVDDLECAIEHISKFSNCDKNSMTKVNMHHSAECMTINNMNNNKHVNLVKVMKVKTRNSATISLDIIAGNSKTAKKLNISSSGGPFWKLLVSFSWRLNFSDFVARSYSEWEITSIRGLQVVCVVAILAAYSSVMMEYLSNNRYAMSTVTMKFQNFLRGNATYLVDMFYFLSGANLTYLYFRTSCQGKCKVLEQIVHFVAMVMYKICCILLPYMVVLICTEISAKYLYANSSLDVPSFDHMTCVHDKWLNVLYIENFFPIAERCMLWTWFISLEVYFFVAACLVLLLAQIHPKYAGAVCTGIFIASILATTVVEVDYIPSVKQDIEHDLMTFYLIFDKIWIRIPPYLLGMCLGYTLFKARGKFEMNIFVIVFGWIACILILVGFGYGFHTVEFRVNAWVRAIISTLGHTIWSMVLFWVVLASISQYKDILSKILTSKLFNSLGKLTNCCLLVGPLIIRSMLQHNESGINVSFGQLLINLIGFITSTYVLAFFLYMLFEAPILVLLKIIYKLFKKTNL